MKKLIVLFAVSSVVFWSCNFSVGTKKDLATGLSVSNSGFSIQESFLVGPDDTPMKNNEVQLNSKVAIVIQGITNYVVENDKAFPGLMLSVTDKNGYAVVDEADLLSNDGYPASDAAILRGTVTVGEPMKSGETYHIKMRIWDKKKPDSEIVAECDIVVL
ncbi:MAG: hypothetical protein ACOYXT_23170 [Bacteroidota bacterium]